MDGGARTVLVCPDKFKGTMTAAQAAAAMGAGLRAQGHSTIERPLADGGDGSVETALAAGYSAVTLTVPGATGEDRSTVIAVRDQKAVVEVASTCGMATLPKGHLAPLDASSYGFGMAVRRAAAMGTREITLALGGSASTDGGAGMLAALGARFLDAHGNDFTPTGRTLTRIDSVQTEGLRWLEDVTLCAASDVDHPLFGALGAAHVFGPQKGADGTQVDQLDDGLRHLSAIATAHTPRLDPDSAGAGAAGGLGFGCAWLGAQRVRGADQFMNLVDFDSAVIESNAIITGEGQLDDQTLGGKVIRAVIDRSRGRPVSAIVGRNRLPRARWAGLGLRGVHDLVTAAAEAPGRAMTEPERLARLVGSKIDIMNAPGQ